MPETVEPAEVSRSNGTLSATVPSVAGGQTITVDIGENGSDDEDGAAVERLNITSRSDASNVRVNFSTSEQPSPGTPAVDKTSTVFRYAEVDVQNLQDANVSEGTFTFRVSEQRLQDRGIDPSNVVMFRYSGGSWETIETSYLGNGRYQAVTPGFSSFAIGVAEPSLAVTDASLSVTETQVGDSTDVSATVENGGSAEGTITLEVTANGEVIDTTDVTVGASEIVTETLSVTFDEAGSYEIAVNDQSAGTLTVTQDATPTAEQTTEPTDETTEEIATTAGDGPSFTALAALLAIVAAALLAARRDD